MISALKSLGGAILSHSGEILLDTLLTLPVSAADFHPIFAPKVLKKSLAVLTNHLGSHRFRTYAAKMKDEGER